jgi:phosphate transport system substrate-binding protein
VSTRSRTARRVAGIGLAIATAAGLVVAGNAATAEPPNPYSFTLAIAGSDTTQNAMSDFASVFNTVQSPKESYAVNIDAIATVPVEVDSDEFCTPEAGSDFEGRIYVAADGDNVTTFNSPNGSGNGRSALASSAASASAAKRGCIDIARSSSAPSGTDPESFEYFAFGLDAVGWASGASAAPDTLTKQQIIDIYRCDITNWSQVGGDAGPIQRYFPQSGSGTRSFFQSDMLDGLVPEDFSSETCPAVVITQENTGRLIAQNGDIEEAIVPYSAADWVAQTRGTRPDNRAGQVVRALTAGGTTQSPIVIDEETGDPALNTAGPINEANVKLVDPTPDYPGVRFVFNVVDTRSPNYLEARDFVGFSEGDNGFICSGDYATTIQNNGFGPLPPMGGADGPTCRPY